MSKGKSKKKITVEEFDRRAEAGEDVSEFFDFDSGIKRFNMDLPMWALRAIDAESERQGQTRQALIRSWIMEKLSELRKEGLLKRA